MNDRIMDAHEQAQDNIEASLRPLSLDEYIGQQGLKENLRVFIHAAKSRNEALITCCFMARQDSEKRHLRTF